MRSPPIPGDTVSVAHRPENVDLQETSTSPSRLTHHRTFMRLRHPDFGRGTRRRPERVRQRLREQLEGKYCRKILLDILAEAEDNEAEFWKRTEP